MPLLLKGAPASLIHFFLDRDPFGGQNVAALLGLPHADWTRYVVDIVVHVERFFGERNIQPSREDKAISSVSRHLIEGMPLLERGGNRAPFYIPHDLRQRWGVRAPGE